MIWGFLTYLDPSSFLKWASTQLEFIWSKIYQESFELVKQMLQNKEFLVHFEVTACGSSGCYFPWGGSCTCRIFTLMVQSVSYHHRHYQKRNGNIPKLIKKHMLLYSQLKNSINTWMEIHLLHTQTINQQVARHSFF